MKLTNNHDISLPIAVWLMHDEYDYVKDDRYISATTLLKPLREIVLAHRVDKSTLEMDIMDLVSSSMGTGLHDSIEKAWHVGHKEALRKLGYPERVVQAVTINPTPEQLKEDPNIIPVYIEQRGIREIAGWKVGGKFDIVTEGLLQDFKSTSTYKWVKGGSTEDYKLQGSVYRWIHSDKITEDVIRINFIFTDWMKALAQNPASNYPPHRIMYKDIPLMDISDTEMWVTNKLNNIVKYWNAPQEDIPECTDEELWKSDPQFKYYSDPAKATQPGARSTKNFDDMMEARKFQAEKGKGIIVTVPGEPKKCNYCKAATICKQRERYFA